MLLFSPPVRALGEAILLLAYIREMFNDGECLIFTGYLYVLCF